MNDPGKEKILIYRLGSLGDTVMALPCFHIVKNAFPQADITLLTNRPVMSKAAPLEAVLGKAYFFDRIIDYPVGARNPFILTGIIKQIRALNITTMVNLTAARSRKSARRDKIFFKLAGIKKFIGFPSLDEDFEVCTDPETGLMEWEAKRLYRRIGNLGPKPFYNNQYWNLQLTDIEEDTAITIREQLPLANKTLAISLGTKNQANDWGIDNWLVLLNRLSVALPDWNLVVLGANDEKQLADRCISEWGKNSLNLCGATSPRVSAALLSHTDLFIGHDSGPLHLAACAGTPSVGIFSARNLPGQWFPRGDKNKIIYNVPACAGCGLEVCITNKKVCILSITVEQVQQAVFEQIEKNNIVVKDNYC